MKENKQMLEDLIEILDEEYEKRGFITPQNTAEKMTAKGYQKAERGEWEKLDGERFICSNCAKVFELGSTATIHDVKRAWKYCPNCGAKMKGE